MLHIQHDNQVSGAGRSSGWDLSKQGQGDRIDHDLHLSDQWIQHDPTPTCAQRLLLRYLLISVV